MKLATWNLERGGRSAAAARGQEAVLRDLRADVLVLTEPGASYRSGPGVVTAPGRDGRRGREAWVAIVGASVQPLPLDMPF